MTTDFLPQFPGSIDPTRVRGGVALVEVTPSDGSAYLFRRELARFADPAMAEAAKAALAADAAPGVTYTIVGVH